MQRLEALAREAEALARGQAAAGPEQEVARVLEICNACRYCEGFCAVFPAMTRRLAFPPGDAHYLANLCHNCGACLHACQYAPPHEFAVNVPRAMAQVRARTYADYAWPRPFGRLYARGGVVAALALAIGLAFFLVLALARNGTLWHAPMEGRFYAVFPHGLMVGLFAPVFLFACVALGVGVARFWRGQSPGAAPPDAVREAVGHALRLTYLDGGHGEGCNDEDDRFTLRRRRFHHFTFYGFLLCFASTSVATIYHYAFGWQAPYALASVPVVLGTLGGVGLLIGPAGLWWLHARRHPLHREPSQSGMDVGLIALLLFTSLTGLAL
ncbi:MAG TPA: tricarballylate utilization 4Fe-4S protein TcuB, partial [Casimicrobiaceae bacterium]|nr:tricarballylate utilization 4Fe-4S protein TcuB [Casimicrobiaceae bacterium]